MEPKITIIKDLALKERPEIAGDWHKTQLLCSIRYIPWIPMELKVLQRADLSLIHWSMFCGPN